MDDFAAGVLVAGVADEGGLGRIAPLKSLDAAPALVWGRGSAPSKAA